jgi:hypothetical protein
VGLLKRLRRAEEWLHWLCLELMKEKGMPLPKERRRAVRIVDGTVVKEPGKTGSQWRIVYSIRLPDLRCDYFHLNVATGAGNGETLTRVPLARHDLILADAGYCSIPGIQSVARQGADVLVRLNPQLPLLNRRGRPFNLLSHLQELRSAGTAREWPVQLPGRIEGRVCAVRKSQAAIDKARRRLERRATKQQSQIKAETWEYAKYVAIFTTDRAATAEDILEWYRLRWQIELTFKRLKSLAQLGHLPKYDDQSSRAWLYGKLFVALLTQKLVRAGRELSPWGYVFAGSPAT